MFFELKSIALVFIFHHSRNLNVFLSPSLFKVLSVLVYVMRFFLFSFLFIDM